MCGWLTSIQVSKPRDFSHRNLPGVESRPAAAIVNSLVSSRNKSEPETREKLLQAISDENRARSEPNLRPHLFSLGVNLMAATINAIQADRHAH
jgi:hypothetical protein